MSQAKTLTPELLRSAAEAVAVSSPRPWQDAAIIAFTYRAGLRACETAGVRWRDVLSVSGEVVAPGELWKLPDNISKKGSGRRIPMHPDLHKALVDLRENMEPAALTGNKPVILRALKGSNTGAVDPRFLPTTPNALQRYISRRFEKIGMTGVTSHSGRRTFITTLARRANTFGCSLRDVQLLAGHKELATTEKYIDLSDGVGDLVGSL